MTVKMEDISENLHGLIKIIGMENFLKVSKALGGSSIYIPIYKNVQMAERNQKKIQELDCPRCHEPGGIEAFVKDGILAEDGVCDNCGYILPEGTELEEVE